MIQKHAIPILEFDDNPQAVIMPTHEGWICTCPKSVSMLLGEEIDRYARKSGRTVLANSFLPPRSIQSMSLTTRVRRSVWLRLLSVQLQQPSLWIG